MDEIKRTIQQFMWRKSGANNIHSVLFSGVDVVNNKNAMPEAHIIIQYLYDEKSKDYRRHFTVWCNGLKVKHYKQAWYAKQHVERYFINKYQTQEDIDFMEKSGRRLIDPNLLPINLKDFWHYLGDKKVRKRLYESGTIANPMDD